MKKSTFISLALGLLAVAAPRALAHPEHEFDALPPEPPPPAQETPKEHGHEHHTEVPATVADIWKEIVWQQARLEKAVAGKKLSDTHDHAFTIRDLARALVTKAPDAKKADAEQAAQKIADLAADIDKSAAAGAQKTTEAKVKALIEAIKSLRLIVPHAHS